MANQVLSLDSLEGFGFPHYRIITVIGSGGMGLLFCARNHRINCKVAEKIPPQITIFHDFDHQGYVTSGVVFTPHVVQPTETESQASSAALAPSAQRPPSQGW
jgi:hypothetical protein